MISELVKAISYLSTILILQSAKENPQLTTTCNVIYVSSSLHWLIIGNQYKMGKAFYCVTGLVCFLLTEEYHFKHNINQYKQSVPQTGLSLQCDCPVTSGTVCFRRSVVTVTQTPLCRKLLFWVQEWTVCDTHTENKPVSPTSSTLQWRQASTFTTWRTVLGFMWWYFILYGACEVLRSVTDFHRAIAQCFQGFVYYSILHSYELFREAM